MSRLAFLSRGDWFFIGGIVSPVIVAHQWAIAKKKGENVDMFDCYLITIALVPFGPGLIPAYIAYLLAKD